MDNNVLERFEQHIEALIDKYQAVKQDNVLLREKQSVLLEERDQLHNKQQEIAGSVEKLINRLRVISENE